MESGKTEDIEEGYIQDGKEVIVHTVKTPIKDEKGKAFGILGIFWDITKSKHADDELKKYRERLEELVEERTAELRNANEQLQREITERKRAEKALRKSEERYRSILENIQDGYFEVDLTGNFTFVNGVICKRLGYSREELIGMNNRQYTGETTAQKTYQLYNRVYRTGEPVGSFEEEIIRKDGTREIYELSVSLIRDSEGKPIGFRGISRDITERKRAEEALRRTEERATQLSRENAIMAEIGRIVSSTLKIEEVYKRFAEEARELIPFDRISINTINPDRTSITIAYFFGVKIEESEEGLVLPLDRPFFEYILNRQSGFLIHPQDESELTERFPNFVRHFRVGIRTMIAVPLISKDQAIGILHIQSLKPNAYTESDVRLAERVGNQIAGAIANAQLFTARQRAEEELRKAHEMLEKRVEERTAELSKANELLKQEIAEREQMQEKLLISERLATLGLFSGSISHELKNPLSTIDSSVYYLKTKLKDADEKVRTHLDRVKSSVGSSLAIIDSLRNLTQIKEPRLQRTDLKSVTLDAIANAEVPETVNVIRNITEQEVLVNADPEQLKMAFKNIVKNAIQAMDGKGTLEVTVGKIDDQVEVSFTDTGPGIASENLDKIFQPLFSTKAKGLGFGLSISKMIIDKHSGTIQAKSEPGKGATILIRLSLNTQS
jgi:PAS domain S-box-containing protein